MLPRAGLATGDACVLDNVDEGGCETSGNVCYPVSNTDINAGGVCGGLQVDGQSCTADNQCVSARCTSNDSGTLGFCGRSAQVHLDLAERVNLLYLTRLPGVCYRLTG